MCDCGRRRSVGAAVLRRRWADDYDMDMNETVVFQRRDRTSNVDVVAFDNDMFSKGCQWCAVTPG